MNAELATLQTQFSQFVLKEKNAESVDGGRPRRARRYDRQRNGGRCERRERAKQESKLVIAMQNTSGQPSLRRSRIARCAKKS